MNITPAQPIQIVDSEEVHEICYNCLESIGQGATFTPKDNDEPITICRQCLLIAIQVSADS